jgi:hypothetical protein
MQEMQNNEDGKLVFVSGEDLPAGLIGPAWIHELEDPLKAKEVASRTAQFIAEARSYERNDLLGLTGLYNLHGGVFSPGTQNTYPETADIEFLQAVTMMPKEGELPFLPREHVSDFWKALQQQVYVLSHNKRHENSTRLEKLSQSHNAYYRNPYGDEFFDKLVLSITEDYDRKYLRDGSFTGIGKALVEVRSKIMSRYREYVEVGNRILTGSRMDKIAATEEFCGEKLPDISFPVEDELLTRGLYDFVEDTAARTIFILSNQWVAQKEQEGLPMERLLTKLTLEESHEEIEPCSVLRLNPVWGKPAVRLEGGYALYSFVTLLTYPFSLFETILGNNDQERKRLEKIRGDFVERELFALLRKALPSARIVQNGYWRRDDGNRVENDLIVFFAGRVLIFEAKGALIPERAKLGTPDATKHFLKRVWGKSTKQGYELGRRIKDLNSPLEITDSAGNVQLVLDPKKIVSITRYSVSIEQMGVLMNAPSSLKIEGVLDADIVPAPCIVLSELSIIFGYLETEESRLHYLARRGEVAAVKDFIGDELDFFSTYLHFGFTDIPQNDLPLMLLGASFELKSLENVDRKIVLPRDSSLRNSAFFTKMLEWMKVNKSPAYPYVSLILADMTFEDQLIFEQGMGEAFLPKNVKADAQIAFVPVKSLGANFVVAGMFFDKHAKASEMRRKANEVLLSLCLKTKAREGFIFVKRLRSSLVYDALYYFAPNEMYERIHDDSNT